MFTNIVFVLAGLALLKYGADYFVSGAASLARKFGISSLVVGLTVISIGTSAPEFFVNMIAAVQGSADLSIGNILGSNLADILLGLGIAAMIVPLSLKRGTVWREIPYALLAAVFLLVFGSDIFIDGGAVNVISRSEGLALLGLFIIFIVYTFSIKTGERPNEQIEVYSGHKTLALLFGGMAGLALGGYVVVEGAVGLALAMGISENLVGFTIVAAGTSLPEIMTAISAAKKGHIDLVVGGIVGTIIFNALFVLGATATIIPLPFGEANLVDALAVATATLILFLSLFSGKKNQVDKSEGMVFIGMYVLYIIFAIWRG